jgi:exonuclease III
VAHLTPRHAQIFLQTHPDIAVLEEVKGRRQLEGFVDNELRGAYDVFLIPGNDPYGNQIAFLVRKGLPFVIEQRSYRDERWADPHSGNGRERLFSRDLPALIVRSPANKEPLFVLLGAHYKSKRDRQGDPQSQDMRRTQVQRTVEIIERLKEEFGEQTRILLAGDLNGEFNQDGEFASLRKRSGFADSFDKLSHPLSADERVTHVYHPQHDVAIKGQIDAVLVSPSLSDYVLDAFVYRYRDADGRTLPLPETYEQTQRNPSDHFPVVVTFDFKGIRDAWNGEDHT